MNPASSCARAPCRFLSELALAAAASHLAPAVEIAMGFMCACIVTPLSVPVFFHQRN